MRRLIPIAMLGLAACSSATGPSGPSMSGVWKGLLAVHDTLTLTVTQSGHNVTGLALFVYGGIDSVGCSISGTHNDPQLSLTLTQSHFAPATLVGTFTDSVTINAVLNGSGFTNQSVTLTRH